MVLAQDLVSFSEAVAIRELLNCSSPALHKALQYQIRAEIRSVFNASTSPDVDENSMQQLVLLHACIYETMRLFPPIPMLLNRRINHTTVVHLLNQGQAYALRIEEGTYVGWHAYGLHRSSRCSIWEPDCSTFRPQRWGSTLQDILALARRAESRGQYISFAIGARACECECRIDPRIQPL